MKHHLIKYSLPLLVTVFAAGCDSDTEAREQNRAPTAENDVFFYEDGETLALTFAQARDSDGDALSFTLKDGPKNGVFAFFSDDDCPIHDDTISRCRFSYTPSSGFTGNDEATFTVNDGARDSELGTLHFVVSETAVNNPPQTQDHEFSGNEDTEISEQLIATDPEGDDVTFSLLENVDSGRLTLFDDGRFDYLPNRDFRGDDTFQFTVSDGNGGEDTATVTLTISCETQNPSGICDWDKLPEVAQGQQPVIAVDTLTRVNIAYLADKVDEGGTAQDLFLSQLPTLGSAFDLITGEGVGGAISSGAQLANNPDLTASAVTPATLLLAWDEPAQTGDAESVHVAARSVLDSTWRDVSGAPNVDGTPSYDPAITPVVATGSPIVTWSSGRTAASDPDLSLATNAGTSANPGDWQRMAPGLDVNTANPASRSEVVAGATTDLPNLPGPTFIAWQELAGNLNVYVKRCNNAADQNANNCALLGNALNVGTNTDAKEPSLAISLSEVSNHRPVAAFAENGKIFVKRYNVDSNAWETLSDTVNASNGGHLNIYTNGVANNPSLVIDVLNRYTVVWEERENASEPSQIFAKRIDLSGGGNWVQLGGVLNCDRDRNAFNPDVAAHPATGVPYVTFEELDENNDSSVHAMQFTD